MKIILFLCLISVAVCKISDDYALENNKFAVDLLEELGKNHRRNTLYSGLSLETLLGLTSLGAKGKTAEEIRKVLHLPQSEEKIKDQVKGLAKEFDKAKHIISITNEIFLAKGVEPKPNFVKTGNELFRTGIRNVDFGKTKDAVKEINSWVSEKTEGKIPELMKEEQISNITKMVLANAIYFNGDFEHPFKIENTKKRDFYLTKNNTVKVETMKVTAKFPIYSSTNHKVTCLYIPYAGTNGRANMGIMVPHDVEGIDDLDNNMKHAVPERFNKYQKKYATLYVPKFKLETTLDLKPTLKNLGITELFSAPDLSGITKDPITADTISQKIVFKVEDKSAEAAVATEEIANTDALPIAKPEVEEIRIDRPFHFGVLFDDVCIFSGRIMNPLEENAN